ncbi:hypothetical protein Dimus_002401 [Dionaea muscipula]
MGPCLGCAWFFKGLVGMVVWVAIKGPKELIWQAIPAATVWSVWKLRNEAEGVISLDFAKALLLGNGEVLQQLSWDGSAPFQTLLPSGLVYGSRMKWLSRSYIGRPLVQPGLGQPGLVVVVMPPAIFGESFDALRGLRALHFLAAPCLSWIVLMIVDGLMMGVLH